MINKSDLVKKISQKNRDFTKKDINEAVSEITNYIGTSLSKGKRVEIRGFGTFSVRNRKPRIGRNPKTGTAVHIGLKYHPYFRASKGLKAILNNN